MKFIKATCRQCGEEVEVPLKETRTGQDFYVYIGMTGTRAHICPRKWVDIGKEDDDTQPYVDPEWVKYEGDRE